MATTDFDRAIEALADATDGARALADGESLWARFEAGEGSAGRAARVALLTSRACFWVGDHERADRYAGLARKQYFADGDREAIGLCDRTRAGALMHLGNWELAFKMLDHRMERLEATGGGLMREGAWPSPTEPRAAVLEEARSVAIWARHASPEWVCALAGLAEVLVDEPIGPELLARYNARLAVVEDIGPIIAELVAKKRRAVSFLARVAAEG